VFYGRWASVATRFAKLNSERIKLFHEADVSGKGSEPTRKALAVVLDHEARHSIKELYAIRRGVICFALAIIFGHLTALINGVSIFESVLTHLVRALGIIVVLLVVLGMCFSMISTYEYLQTQSKSPKVQYALQKYPITALADNMDKEIEEILKKAKKDRRAERKNYKKDKKKKDVED